MMGTTHPHSQASEASAQEEGVRNSREMGGGEAERSGAYSPPRVSACVQEGQGDGLTASSSVHRMVAVYLPSSVPMGTLAYQLTVVGPVPVRFPFPALIYA